MKHIKRIMEFLSFFGTQNDYLFPNSHTKNLWHPFKKPHLWKTRFGFKTSWELAKIIHP